MGRFFRANSQINIRLASLLLIAASLPTCRPGRAPVKGGFEFTDGLGRRIVMERPPERIVSFAPSLTEMVYALGGDEKLVGVTSWCTYPPRAREKMVVGDYYSPNWERIVALRPDLILLVGTADSPILSRFGALGIPAAAFRSEGFDDIIGDLVVLGKILGKGPAADSLTEMIRCQAESLERAVEPVPFPERPRVFAEISAQPLMSCGDSSFIGRLISAAGGVNVTGGLAQPYGAVNAEQVIVGGPDIILVLHPAASAADVAGRLGWGKVPAVRKSRIVTGLDLDLMMRPGPRFMEAAGELHRVFYGKK